jgi:putative ABC transport system permease protein
VDNFALGGGTSYTSLTAEGRSVSSSVFAILPGYFETIGATLRAGRLLSDADYASGFRGVVLNEASARLLFPDGPAVGRQFSRAGRDREPWTVLGVIADLRHGGPLRPPTREMDASQAFFPLEPTASDLIQAMMVVVRPVGPAPELAERLRGAAQAIGPRVLVERIRSGEDWFGDRVITPRRRAVLLGLLGGLGLVLTLVGVFGMTAYAVARRTTEIGVRMAFGARPGQVVGTMVRDSAMPIVLGTALGLGAAALATRVIESFLFETTPTDTVTFAAVALTLTATGCLAALIPALRASKVDPVTALRAD